jgi:hypothetical protein
MRLESCFATLPEVTSCALYRVFTVLTNRSRLSRDLPHVLLAKYDTVVDGFGENVPASSNDPLFGSYQSLQPASLIFGSLQLFPATAE